MRIVIDLQGAQTQSRYRGIGRYSLSLAKAMCRNRGDHEVIVVVSGAYPETIEPLRKEFSGLLLNSQFLVYQVPPRIAYDHDDYAWRRMAATYIRESFLQSLSPDLLLVSSLIEGSTEDACTSVKAFDSSIVTATIVYDLIPLLDPDDYLGASWAKHWYYEKVEHLARSDLLLSISEYSRRVAIERLHLTPAIVVNISTAVSEEFSPPAQDDDGHAVKSRFGIRRPYLIYSGSFEARKNLDRWLTAFSTLPDEVRRRYEIVLAGKHSDFDAIKYRKMAARLGFEDQLVLTGYTTDEELIELYRHAALCVFPSLHEGFGLPALEAMSCGTPAIGSNVTSIPEVIGLSDAMFNPFETAEIAECMERALTDIGFVEQLVEHARVHSAKFTWDNCAMRAIEAMEEVVEERGRNVKGLLWTSEDRHNRLLDAIADIDCGVSPSHDDVVAVASCIASNERLVSLPTRLTWRIEGPFDSSYSLALLNRETARALKKLGHEVMLYSTEGPGDFDPDPSFLAANPDLADMHAACADVEAVSCDVTSRNLYPPRVAGMVTAQRLLHHYAWEESGFPTEWVESFNQHLTGITCLSTHVQKVLIDAGVTVPMTVSGCGVDHWEAVQPAEDFSLECRSFRFLHVSSCFPRKGIKELLQAYAQSFRDEDDVTLIVKTFPNPHNNIREILAEERKLHESFPHVVLVERELTDRELKSLVQSVDVLVAPSYAEGFGLPLAEAMLSEVGVITTNWSGQLDFCDQETCWLVDFDFAPSESHFGLFDSTWAVPKVDSLAATMQEVYRIPRSLRRQKALSGRKRLLERFSWESVSARLVTSARDFARGGARSAPKVGWVTTWKTRCGVATYSEHLLREFETSPVVLSAYTDEIVDCGSDTSIRCWSSLQCSDFSLLEKNIFRHQIDCLVVQFNYGFFEFAKLAEFLDRLNDEDIAVAVMMHSTYDPPGDESKRLKMLASALARCDRLLVHSIADLQRLKLAGLVDNVALFPHGILDSAPVVEGESDLDTFTIASYGFFLPNKGLPELVRAFSILKRNIARPLKLRMINAEYPLPISTNEIASVRKLIDQLGLESDVDVMTEFLLDEECLGLLGASDLVVFPYQDTGESASGAVRYGIASTSDVAVTPIPIFDDVRSAVHTLPGTTPEDIAAGLEELVDEISTGSDFLKRKREEAERWRQAHLYSAVARRLSRILQALHNKKAYNTLENSIDIRRTSQ